MRKVMLVIRDGWGYREDATGNAILHSHSPFNDFLVQDTPQALLVSHGPMVGLPSGFQGSSEVGHMNMGAGRIVEQEVTRIFAAMKERTLFKTPRFLEIEEKLSRPGVQFHLFGLLQDEGVHAHQEHLFEMIRYIKQRFPDLIIWVHPIADGRDTPPHSFQEFYTRLLHVIGSCKHVKVGTVCGRYYGMDRSKQWNLIETAYRAMVFGEGLRTQDVMASIFHAYHHSLTPDHAPMFDEYLPPLITQEYPGMNPGDVVLNFNYRQDRAIQISKAFCDRSCVAYHPFSSDLHYYGLTQYYDEFDHYLMAPISTGKSMMNLLGEVISNASVRQLRIAETQKFRHVTSFFNGKRTKPYPNEDQVEVPSAYDPSTFASHPEMNAGDVTRELLQRLDMGYDFILVNYANCDMVGHTGNFNAAVEGAECVDRNVKCITEKALQFEYVVLITADHGNSEEMLDSKGNPKTSHTLNPVKLHMLDPMKRIRFGSTTGILSDIAPLILTLMDLPIPEEMTARTLSNTLLDQT